MGKIFDALKKEHANRKMISAVSEQKDDEHITIPIDTETTVASPSQVGSFALDKNLVCFLNNQSFEAEQFKLLKTNLLFPAKGETPRIIMVTSAAPNEGKSFVAANLAISISQNIDEHVLLLDCDLRLPTIHKLFGLGEGSGLSDYLSKNTPIKTLLRKTNIGKLSILTAGAPPKNPAELLTSEKMAQLLTEVKERYSDRYVILDTAPPQLTAESNALARKVDGVLVVVNFGSTKRKAVANLVEIIGKEKILGIILNRFDMRASAYYGYGKYSDYSKYYSAR